MLKRMTNCDCCEVCTGICTGAGYTAVLCDGCECEMDPEALSEQDRTLYRVGSRWLCAYCALDTLPSRPVASFGEGNYDPA